MRASAIQISSGPIWPSLDMSPLSGGLREAPELPTRLLGSELASVCASLAGAKGAPVDYVAAGVLAVAGGLVGNARWTEVWPGWREPCALWIGLVGGPSSSKSPALDPALTIAREIDAEKAEAFGEILRRWETEIETAKVAADAWREDVRTAHDNRAPAPTKPEAACEPEKPGRPRIVVMDSTAEALAAILASNPKGACMFRDELAGFIAGQGRYGDDAARPFFLESWGGRSFTVDRVKLSMPIIIPHLTLSVVGGIQPDRLNSLLLAGDDDGLAARFLFVWPDPTPPVRPVGGYDLSPLSRAFRRLDNLVLFEGENGSQPGVVRFSDEAARFHQAERMRWHSRHANAAGHFGSFIGKIPGMALRLSGLLALTDWAFGRESEPPETIPADIAERAWAFFEDYFEPMALRVYGDAAIPQGERDAASIARKIFERKELTINARTIRLQWGIPGIRTAARIDAALGHLQEAGWVRPAPTRQGGSSGRQSKTYEVNPDVFC